MHFHHQIWFSPSLNIILRAVKTAQNSKKYAEKSFEILTEKFWNVFLHFNDTKKQLTKLALESRRG